MYTTRLLLLCAFGVVFSFAKAQVPQGVNYQAVLRNTQGDIMANTSACYRFTIIDSTTTGPAVYQETHQVTTNQFGLMTVQIGSGTPVQGTFAGIQWAHNSKYLLVELDANCTGTYVIMGQSQMLSVPYALYAGSAGNAQGGLQLWDTAGANIYNFNSGNVGIGTTKPAMLLDVNTAVDTNGSAAIRGTNTGDTTAVYGIAGYVQSTNYNSAGVYGLSKAQSGYTQGIYGEAMSVNGTGVYGQSDTAGTGVIGYANSVTGPGIGVSGGTASPQGIGVLGTGGVGVMGVGSRSDTGIAAMFTANSGASANYAIIVPHNGGLAGIGNSTPLMLVDVDSGATIGTSVTSISEHDPSNRGAKVNFGYYPADASYDFAGMTVQVDSGRDGCGNSGDVIFKTWQCNTHTGREVARFDGFGNLGIGTASPSATLDVENNMGTAFKMVDGTQGAGKILTSDASGNASWQTPGDGVQFFAVADTDTKLANVAYTQLPFQKVNFNDGGGYNDTTNTFTAPSAGLYHFDVNITIQSATSGDQNYMYLVVNGSFKAGTQGAQTPIAGAGENSLVLSTCFKLNAGDTVLVTAWSYGTTDKLFTFPSGNTCYFSGYKVR